MIEIKLPLTHMTMTRRVSDNNQDVLYEVLETEVPMTTEQKDAYEQIVGDAQAKITTSRSISEKNFGTGRDAFLSITLTVHQSEQHIRYGIDLAKALCDQILEQHWLELKQRPLP